MTIFLCLIGFSIYDKMQGFILESRLFIYLFVFCILCRISRWPPKVVGKQFLRKVSSRLCRYPVGQKFCRNHSILLRFRVKHIFLFNTDFQDSWQQWSENVFCEIMPVDSADTLRVKNFVEIAPSHFISKINTFLHFTQKFKMAPKSDGKQFLSKVGSRLCKYPGGQNCHRNLFISLHFRDKHVFAFYAEIQDGRQKKRKNNF